jgi:hypothetical protein
MRAADMLAADADTMRSEYDKQQESLERSLAPESRDRHVRRVIDQFETGSLQHGFQGPVYRRERIFNSESSDDEKPAGTAFKQPARFKKGELEARETPQTTPWELTPTDLQSVPSLHNVEAKAQGQWFPQCQNLELAIQQKSLQALRYASSNARMRISQQEHRSR